MPGIREIGLSFELRATLIEQASGKIEVAETHVHIADAEEGAALQSWIVAAPALRQHAIECVERSSEIALPGERSTEAFEGAGFASGVGRFVIERAAASIIDNRAVEISLHELHVAGADERGRDSQWIVQTFLDG